MSIAQANVDSFFGELPRNWELRSGSVQSIPAGERFDRVIFDMLAPWDCLESAASVLRPGGVLCCYVATTTQLSRTAEAIKESGKFAEPESFEAFLRPWHHEGLAVRPQHSMNAHTGFLLFARRVDAESTPLKRRRRPAKGSSETNSN